MSNTWLRREEKWNVTYRLDENEAKIDIVLITKEHRRFSLIVVAIPEELQHSLVVADIDKKKIRKVVRKICTERRRISLLKDGIRKSFEENIIEFVDFDIPNLWGHFKSYH